MIVERLELENFLSYRELRLDFPKGSVVFVGENGAGKSSLLDAIMFALFKVNPRGGLLADLIRRGARRASVKLVFRANGARYSVEREILCSGRRASTRAILRDAKNGRVIALDSAVQPEIERILGMNQKMFEAAVYVKQGEIASLLEMKPGERKQIIAKLLGIEDLEKAYNGMRYVIQNFEKRVERLKGEVSLLPSLREQLKGREAELSEVTRELVALDREKVALDKKLEVLEDRFRQLEERKKVYEELKSALEAERKRLLDLKLEYERVRDELRKAEEAEARLEMLKKSVELLDLARRAVEISRIAAEREKALKVLRDRLSQVERAAETVQRFESYAARAKQVREELEQIRAEVQGLMEAFRAIREKQGFLEKLRRELAREQAILNDYLRRVSDTVGRRVSSYSEAVKAVSEEMSALTARLEGIKRELEDCVSEKANLAAEKERLSKWVEELGRSGSRCPLCQSPLSDDKRAELLSQYTRRIEKIRVAMHSIKDRIERLRSEASAIEERIELLRRLEGDAVKRVIDRISELEGEIGRLQAEVEVADELKRKFEELKRKEEALAREEEHLRKLEVEYYAAKRLVERENPEELRLRVNALEGELLGMRKEYVEIIEKLGRPSDLNVLIAKLEREKAEYEKALSQAARKEYLVLEEERLLEAISSEEQQVRVLEERLREIGFSEDEYVRVRSELSDVRARRAGVVERAKALLERRSRLRLECEELKRKIDEIAGKAEELKSLEEYIDFLKKLRELYGKDGLQRDVREYARPLIEAYLKEFSAMFEFDFLDVRLTDDFNVVVVDSAGEREMTMVSGGERVAIALALRLAIAKAIAGGRLGFMMLDEPTQHLDEVRRRYLVGAIAKLFGSEGEAFPQLLLVTHDRELEEAGDVVFYVEKRGGTSRVTRAGESV